MIRFSMAALLLLVLAGCHTTDLGRSVGWPAPQRSAP